MNVPLDSIPSQGNFLAVNDIELYYEVYGEGPPLLLVHGFTVSGQSWQPFVEDLSRHYRLIIPDMRGHGWSTNPTKQFLHRQVALDLFALLDHLRIDQCKAMGISSGGMSLLHLATQQPARLEHMVLIGTASHLPEQARVVYREQTPESDLWDWSFLRQVHQYGDEQIRAILEQFHGFKDNYDDINFTRPYLSTISAKTLIIHGDHDFLFPISIAVEMHQSIPNAYLWIVPDGQHVPIYEQRSQSFVQIALEFLGDEWG